MLRKLQGWWKKKPIEIEIMTRIHFQKMNRNSVDIFKRLKDIVKNDALYTEEYAKLKLSACIKHSNLPANWTKCLISQRLLNKKQEKNLHVIDVYLSCL